MSFLSTISKTVFQSFRHMTRNIGKSGSMLFLVTSSVAGEPVKYPSTSCRYFTGLDQKEPEFTFSPSSIIWKYRDLGLVMQYKRTIHTNCSKTILIVGFPEDGSVPFVHRSSWYVVRDSHKVFHRPEVSSIMASKTLSVPSVVMEEAVCSKVTHIASSKIRLGKYVCLKVPVMSVTALPKGSRS